MPDFGLTEALSAALKASKGVSIVPEEEGKLAASASKSGPAAPNVPPGAAAASQAPVARVPSVEAPSAIRPPDSLQAPPIDASLPPQEVPPQAAAADAAQPVSAEVPPGAADAAPPTPVTPEPPVAPPPATPAPEGIAPANQLPPQPTPPEAPLASVVADAQRFVKANLSDFHGKLDMSHMPNVDTMSSPDGVKAAILQVADDNKAAIETARGGTVSDEHLIGLAQDLAVNQDSVKQALAREFGDDPVKLAKVALAARMVEQQQVGMLFSIGGKIADGTVTNEELVRYEQLKQQYVQYRTQLSGAAAVSGRTNRAFGIPVGLPADVMDHIADIISRNNPDLKAEAKAIKLAGTPQGIANIIQGSLAYRALVKAPFNLLQRVFINGILSGPQTWAKIIFGNNPNLLLNSFDLYVAGLGRSAAGLASRLGGYPTAEEGVQLSDAYAHLHGVISGGSDALRVFGRILKTGESLDGILRSEEDFGGQKIATGEDAILPELRDSYFGGIARVLGSIVDAPGERIIGSIDAFTRTLGERGYMTMMSLKEIRARMQAGTLRPGDAEAEMVRMMQNPSEEMSAAAAAWGRRMTFQTQWPVGGAGEAFQKVLQKVPALRFIFPFMRTATNIFKQSLVERTPLAVFSARIRNQIAAGGFEGDLAKARIATGTAVGSMLAWMAIHDRITGDAPKDAKQRADWELDGRRPYSIRITDPITGKESWHSYQWFEPMATIAGAVSDAVQLKSYVSGYNDADSMMPHDQHINDAIANIMASIIQNTGNKTFMQGAAQFAEMYNDPKRAFSMWMSEVGASMVPFSGATKFVRNEQDPFMRQAFGLLDKVRDDLPTVFGVKGSKTLPARLDVFGEPRKSNSGNAILGPLNPFPGNPVQKDALTDEIHDVMERTRTVPITMPSQQLAMLGHGQGLQDGQGMRLTPREYNEYVRLSRSEPNFDGGKLTFREKLEQIIQTPTYQQSTPAERKEMIEQVQNAADKMGRERLFREDDDFRERMTEWTADMNRLKYNH